MLKSAQGVEKNASYKKTQQAVKRNLLSYFLLYFLFHTFLSDAHFTDGSSFVKKKYKYIRNKDGPVKIPNSF